MAKSVVAERGISIRLACVIFSVSQTCYRYEANKDAENEQIANWLLRHRSLRRVHLDTVEIGCLHGDLTHRVRIILMS